ncbi:hypothetical protein [Bradyrhizobium sp. HKCCYLR20261]|uniref:hypothetical protein n=1 Tax=Bradyrhizobium sp. HKCCYLR20261 TaxID=3420760 RepID=UPI003EBDE2A3
MALTVGDACSRAWLPSAEPCSTGKSVAQSEPHATQAALQSSEKRVRDEAHLINAAKAIAPISRNAPIFYFPKIRNRAIWARPALMRGAPRDRHERGGRDAVGAPVAA